MKFDMSKAWNDASAMISANLSLVAVLAGVFVFLPNLALGLFLPGLADPAQSGGDVTKAVNAILKIYAEHWWAFVLMAVVQTIGTLALLALMGDRARPTVGEALGRGLRGFLPYIGAQLLALAGIVVVIGVPIGAAIAAGKIVAGLVGLIGFVAAVYLWIKFSLASPTVALEGLNNPLRILQRSWNLTKGNSARLLGFYLLIGIAVIVISIIVTMVLGVIFAAIGGQLEVIGVASVNALVNSATAVIFLAVLASTYRQLAQGQDAGSASDQL